jgi:peptidyl-prolyl cis-trans isomerase C
MRRVIIYPFLLLLVVLLSQGCAEKKKETVENKADLAARIGDWTLTKDELYNYLDRMPPGEKEKYNTHKGRADLAELMMTDEFYYREAVRTNLEEDADVKAILDEAKRRILVQAFYKKNVEDRARPTEEEMREWYDNHHELYSTMPGVRAQHVFSKSKEKLDDILVRIQRDGEKLTTMAHKYSEDEITKYDGGDLGFFNPSGYIRGIGFSETFADTVFKMEPHKIYGPIKWERGYSLVRVNEVRPAELRPFDDVKQQISDRLMRDNIEKAKREVLDEIRKHYDWNNYMEEYYKTVQRTPEELFEYAQNTNQPYERIKAFEEIVDKFPDDEHAPQALFMVGFVHLDGTRTAMWLIRPSGCWITWVSRCRSSKA